MKYVYGTRNYGIWYTSSNNFGLVHYTDGDWAGSFDDRKSTSGYVFNLGLGVVLWCPKKQPTISLSSTEAEYIAATTMTCESIWLKKVLLDIKQEPKYAKIIYCDNLSTIAITKNLVFHNRTKHIDIKYHFIRDYAEKGEIEIKFFYSK